MQYRCLTVVTLGFLWLGSSLLPAQEVVRFVDDEHADFIQGGVDDGGHNLYVAHDGSLRTINRFDLNADGYLDVLFNCTHDTYQMLSATVGQVNAERVAQSDDLSFEGSQQVVLHDLNRDGFTDVVISPNPIGVHHDRRFVMIGWGGPDGWSSLRISSPLPMNAPATVEVADLNHDHWPDIAVLGAGRWRAEQPEGRIVRIYWGSESGFGVTEFHDLGIPGALDLVAGDFDGDQGRDLIVLKSDAQLLCFWSVAPVDGRWSPQMQSVPLPDNSARCLAAADMTGDQVADVVLGTSQEKLYLVSGAQTREFGVARTVTASAATQITIADFDRDQQPDLVLSRFDQARAAGGEQAGAGKESRDQVRILWGDVDGYNNDRSASLKIPYAVATSAADLDGDGHLDLAVAVHQGERTFQGESVVYFGDGKRQFEPGKNGFRTSGTLDVACVPAEQGLPARVLFCNSIGGYLDEAVPLHLYWGGQDGFDPKRYWRIPFQSGYEGSAADLNADGFADLMILNSGHAGSHAQIDPTLGANILWGGPQGLENSRQRQVLHEHFLGTSSVVDLNRDGWLDLVLEPFGPEDGQPKEKLFLYYGSKDGFQLTGRVELIMDGYAQEHLVADVNRDYWLDIIVTSRSLDCVRILWGGPQGYAVEREQRLKVSGPLGVDAADFNRDGWLDLVIGSYNDPVSGHRDMGLIIFWGSPTGHRHSNTQWLPGFSPLGRTVADFDGDGYLDLFSPQHSGELTREDLACHIYWGSDTGFGTRRRTTLFSDSVNDSMAADFNHDGHIDLAVNCHTRHGDHRTLSKIFYNDGSRFQQPKIQQLPTNGPHLIWATDVGHLYHRQYQHAYESRIWAWDRPLRSGKLVVNATMPTNTRLDFEWRSAASPDQLAKQAWSPAIKGIIAMTPEHRYGQYRAVLISDNGDRYPVIRRVEVELAP